jgi:hypothetical protein
MGTTDTLVQHRTSSICFLICLDFLHLTMAVPSCNFTIMWSPAMKFNLGLLVYILLKSCASN